MNVTKSEINESLHFPVKIAKNSINNLTYLFKINRNATVLIGNQQKISNVYIFDYEKYEAAK